MTLTGERIPTEPFGARALELVKSGRASWSDLARAMGYHQKRWEGNRGVNGDGRVFYRPQHMKPDISRVRRALGLANNGTKVRPYYRKTMTVEEAERWCRALRLDPVDVGL